MLYDLADGPPVPGTLSELVFTIIAKRREETEFLKTRLLVEAILAPHAEGGEGLKNAYKAYREAALPFIGKEEQREREETKKLLDKWTNKVLKVRPLWLAKENKKLHSRLKKQAERIQHMETMRSKHRHTPI